MAYSHADCAHNIVCTTCPSRTTCDMRKIFYNERKYLRTRHQAFVRALSSARTRGFSDSESESLAEDSVAVMDYRRNEELKLHPQYSKT